MSIDTLSTKDTLTLQIEIPLIKRSDRFVVANSKVYFVGTVGAGGSLSWNLFEVDDYGNRVFPEGYDSLEKLSTATYDFLGKYETFGVNRYEFYFEK